MSKKITHHPAVRNKRTPEEIARDIERQKKLCTYPKCRRHGVPIPFADFYTMTRYVDGVNMWCKECVHHYKTQTAEAEQSEARYRESHREQINKTSSDRYRELELVKAQLDKVKGALKECDRFFKDHYQFNIRESEVNKGEYIMNKPYYYAMKHCQEALTELEEE